MTCTKNCNPEFDEHSEACIKGIDARIKELIEERCDCIISIRASTTCWRCRELKSLLNEKKKEKE